MGMGIIKVTAKALEQVLQLPDGCKIKGMHYNPEMQILAMTVESNDIPETAEGATLPILRVLYRTIEASIEVQEE